MDRLFVMLQFLLPQHTLSRAVRRLTRIRTRWFKDALIRGFIRLFRVDMEDAVNSEPAAYVHFNAFFTRALREGARPLPPSRDEVACPVDGAISICGKADDRELLQAKDRRYRLHELLDDDALAVELEGGAFATIYLAPYNYHRIHMPVDGQLTRMRYIPGRLFSVNAATVKSVPRLFARNERVVCRFQTSVGSMAMVLVGALNVGSIETVWAGEVAPGRPRLGRTVDYPSGIRLRRGDEMGRFNMGSTVILIFPAGHARLMDSLVPGRSVKMGEALGRLVSGPDQDASVAT